jgi:hypothetical protein
MMSWGETHFQGAVEPLCKLLKEHDKFMARQKLVEIGKDEPIPETLEAHLKARKREGDLGRVYQETYNAVWVLGVLGDPKARQAIEETKNRWRAIKKPSIGIDRLDPLAIVKECDTALKSLRKP